MISYHLALETSEVFEGSIELDESYFGGIRKGKEVAHAQWKQALHMVRPMLPNWRPPVINVSSLKKEGVAEFWKTIEGYREVMTRTGEFRNKRKKQALDLDVESDRIRPSPIIQETPTGPCVSPDTLRTSRQRNNDAKRGRTTATRLSQTELVRSVNLQARYPPS